MGKRRKKLSALLCAVLCLSFGSSALADEGVITLQQPEWQAAAIKEPMQPFGTYLASGTCGVSEIGTGKVRLKGETNCYRTATTVTVTAYLECLDEDTNSWYTVDSKSGSGSNTSYVSVYKDINVARDHYYRAEGFHSAKKGSTYETQSSVSPRIYID